MNNTTINTPKTNDEYTHAGFAGTCHGIGYLELCRADGAVLTVRPNKNGSTEFAVWSFGVTADGYKDPDSLIWGFYSRSSAAALAVFADRANVDPIKAFETAVLGLVRCLKGSNHGPISIAAAANLNAAQVTINPIS